VDTRIDSPRYSPAFVTGSPHRRRCRARCRATDPRCMGTAVVTAGEALSADPYGGTTGARAPTRSAKPSTRSGRPCPVPRLVPRWSTRSTAQYQQCTSARNRVPHGRGRSPARRSSGHSRQGDIAVADLNLEARAVDELDDLASHRVKSHGGDRHTSLASAAKARAQLLLLLRPHGDGSKPRRSSRRWRRSGTRVFEADPGRM